ncbi:MAG TPA: GFA family protein [Rhizomicrobium sp.]|nr:GFA family protein [Rhizomicrobium sp.]
MKKIPADPVNGRCLCGAVEFRLVPLLEEITHCHCRSCRLSRGVAFVTWTSVPPDRFAYVKGEASVSWYRSSPGVRWGFCGTCGSPMFYIADRPGHPDLPRLDHVYVSLGSLTGQITSAPCAHVSYEERVCWYEPTDTLPKFRGKTGAKIS